MKSWPTIPLGQLVLPTEQRDPNENPTEEFSYVDIASVDNETKSIGTTKRIVGADAPSRARKVIHTGDVIVSTVRPNLNAVALVPSNLDNQICSTGFSVLRPSPKVMSGYLFAFARSPLFVDYLVARTTGANYPAVNDGEVKDVLLPVPPLAEQERIVMLLDEADELRKLRAQADRHATALIPALFHEMFGDSDDTQHGFSICRLGDISETVMGQAPAGKDCNFAGKGTLFVKTGEFGEHRPIIREWTTNPLRMARASDVLVCVVGATCGKLNLGADCAIGRSVAAIRPNTSQLDQEFLYAFLQKWTLRLRSGSQGSAQGVITRDMLESIPVPLPPLAKQKEFAQRVTEIRELEASQATSRTRLDALFQSMLHRAFNREL
jgi:type I restriction enzyme S subunit